MGRELEYCLSVARSTCGSGLKPLRSDSWRGAFCDASHQPAGGALCLSRRADCVSGQTSLQQTMEGADGAARQIGGVQQKSFEQRTQPTLMKAPDTTLLYKLTSSVSGD